MDEDLIQTILASNMSIANNPRLFAETIASALVAGLIDLGDESWEDIARTVAELVPEYIEQEIKYYLRKKDQKEIDDLFYHDE